MPRSSEIPCRPLTDHFPSVGDPVGSPLVSEAGSSKRRIRLAVLVATAGIAEIAFAVQIRTWHPGQRRAWPDFLHNEVFVASWLESEMWVDPWLLLAGVTTIILAVVTFFMYPRLAARRGARERTRSL